MFRGWEVRDRIEISFVNCILDVEFFFLVGRNVKELLKTIYDFGWIKNIRSLFD